MATTSSEQDAFQVNTGELMLAISRDRKKHPEAEKGRSHRKTAPQETSGANKAFGFVIAMFIGLAAAITLMQS